MTNAILLMSGNKPEDYWCIGGNYWNKSSHPYAVALELASTMVNCRDCINCKRCTNCTYCNYSNDCINCHNCRFCYGCTGLRTRYGNDFDKINGECNYTVCEDYWGYALRGINLSLTNKITDIE